MSDTYSLTLFDGSVLETLATNERTADRRPIFAYTIIDGTGEVVGTGRDLHGSVDGDQAAEEMMASLLGFLYANAEAEGPESDNWDLFSPAVHEWAKANADEISIEEYELEVKAEVEVTEAATL